MQNKVNYLFIDIETNGKANLNTKYTEINQYPRIVQLAYIFIQAENNVKIKEIKYSSYIYPDNWEIPKEKFFIDNELTTEKCKELGNPIKEVLENFISAYNLADMIIAHNLKFDLYTIGSEMVRYDLKVDKPIKKYCTMLSSVNILKLPGYYGDYKWPSLEEAFLYFNMFKPINSHEALEDVKSCINIFCHLNPELKLQ